MTLMFIFAAGVHATGPASKMLRDAAIFHDEQRIKHLIDKEVQAMRQDDFQALSRAIGDLSKATDPLPPNSASY